MRTPPSNVQRRAACISGPKPGAIDQVAADSYKFIRGGERQFVCAQVQHQAASSVGDIYVSSPNPRWLAGSEGVSDKDANMGTRRPDHLLLVDVVSLSFGMGETNRPFPRTGCGGSPLSALVKMAI